MTTTTKAEELYKLQHEINTYVTQKEDLYKQMQESQTAFNVDTANMGYVFKSTATMTPQAKHTENKAKFQALKAYFVKNYNDNTKMRDYYFKEIDGLNTVLREQEGELSELGREHDQLETEASTDYRRLKDEKYLLAKQDYTYHLYVIAIVCQLVILLVLGLAWNKSVPRLTAYVVMGIIYIGLLVYVVYMIYIHPGLRDPIVFDKQRIPIKGDVLLKTKAGTKTEAERKAEKEIDAKVNKLLSDSAGKCS